MTNLIGEKLDFLMRLTNTQNSVLGRALNFDASYISRIRSGKRGMPRHPSFVNSASTYFAQNIEKPYQRNAAAEEICPGHFWPDSRQDAAALIAAWLTGESAPGASEPVASFLDGLSQLSPFTSGELPISSTASAGNENICLLYGNEGKRQGVEALLRDLSTLSTPQVCLVFSNENMSWLIEDAEFTKRWTALLERLLNSGSRIRIIHTVSRDTGEMLEAIRRWLPLYMTNAIEPWYYPGERDPVLRRTLVVAQGHSALISTSIGDQTEERLNILLRDPRAVAALETEFTDHLRLCQPLMESYLPEHSRRFSQALIRLRGIEGDLLLSRTMPSLGSMPPDMAEAVAIRCNSRRFAARCRAERADLFARLRAGYTVTELLHFPSLEEAEDGFPVPVSVMLDSQPLRLTRTELAMHLRSALKFSREEPHYRLLCTDAVPSNIQLSLVGDSDVLVVQDGKQSAAFLIREKRMCAAFHAYFHRLTQSELSGTSTRSRLDRFISELKK